MFSFTGAKNDTSKRADPVENLDCGPNLPGPIWPSVILNAYNVYSFAHSDGGKTHAFIFSVALKLLEKRRIFFYILTVCKIRNIAFCRPARVIALQLDAVHAKTSKIARVSLLVSREINIAYQTNYD